MSVVEHIVLPCFDIGVEVHLSNPLLISKSEPHLREDLTQIGLSGDIQLKNSYPATVF